MVWVCVNGDSEVITNTIYSKLGSAGRATPGRFDCILAARNTPAYDKIEYVEPETYDHPEVVRIADQSLLLRYSNPLLSVLSFVPTYLEYPSSQSNFEIMSLVRDIL